MILSALEGSEEVSIIEYNLPSVNYSGSGRVTIFTLINNILK